MKMRSGQIAVMGKRACEKILERCSAIGDGASSDICDLISGVGSPHLIL